MSARGVSIALGVSVLVLFVPGAQAATIAPNSGFEMECAGVPCSWQAAAGTLAWDNTTANSGSASAHVTGIFEQSGIRSDCITLSAWGGYTNTFAYRALGDGSAPTGVFWNVYHYADSACTPATFLFGNGPSFNSVTADGQWHQTPVQFLFIANTVGSVQLSLQFLCGGSPGCPAPATRSVWFDDTDFEPPAPTAVAVRSFAATRSRAGVTLRWRTAVEAKVLGFNVYRSAGARSVRVNRVLIPAAGALTGRWYTLLDRAPIAVGGAAYRLQAIGLDGTRAWAGTVRVAR